MKLYKIGEVAEMKNLSYDRARSLMRSEIEKGNWSRTKINGTVYYYSLVENIDWHDIFNLRSRKAQGQAWDEYRRIVDEHVYG